MCSMYLGSEVQVTIYDEYRVAVVIHRQRKEAVAVKLEEFLQQ